MLENIREKIQLLSISCGCLILWLIKEGSCPISGQIFLHRNPIADQSVFNIIIIIQNYMISVLVTDELHPIQYVYVYIYIFSIYIYTNIYIYGEVGIISKSSINIKIPGVGIISNFSQVLKTHALFSF